MQLRKCCSSCAPPGHNFKNKLWPARCPPSQQARKRMPCGLRAALARLLLGVAAACAAAGCAAGGPNAALAYTLPKRVVVVPLATVLADMVKAQNSTLAATPAAPRSDLTSQTNSSTPPAVAVALRSTAGAQLRRSAGFEKYLPIRGGFLARVKTAPAASRQVPAALARAAVAPERIALERIAPERIVAARIGLDAAIGSAAEEADGNWQIPYGLAGWLPTSAGFGTAGNTVLAGHQNTQGMVFRNLNELVPGDELDVYANGAMRKYAVTERLIVPIWYSSPAEQLLYASFIHPTRDDRLTLISCWPFFTNTHRLIIVAHPRAAS
ncbi:MAG: sortase [Chloroflexi bacterium]|nr:sortase [Chloroflexota bacterium]